MKNKNGIEMKGTLTICNDGDRCVCHFADRLCSVCRSLGCVLRTGAIVNG